jgi:hypothetical protein
MWWIGSSLVVEAMHASDWIALGAVLVAVVSAAIAYSSWRSQERLSKDMFKRAGVIDLHNAWANVNDVDPSKLITPDVVKAVNALNLTSALWLHDIIEREILHQSYWEAFKNLYDRMDRSTAVPPGIRKSLNELLSPPIRRAYQEMEQWEQQKRATSTRLRS